MANNVDPFEHYGVTPQKPPPNAPAGDVAGSVSAPTDVMPEPAWQTQMRDTEDVDPFDYYGATPQVPAAPQQPDRPWTYQYDMGVEHPDTFWEGVTYWPRVALKTGANTGAIITKGARDLATNVLALPSDIAEYAGAEWGGDVSRAIRSNIPDIELRGSRPIPQMAARVASDLVQYGVPAAQSSKVARNVLQGTHWIVRNSGQLLAAISSDIAASGEEETQTLGNLLREWGSVDIGTAIEPGDQPMERRFKVGAEAGGIFAAAAPVIALVKLGIKTGGPVLYKSLQAIGLPEATARSLTNQTMQGAAAHGPEKAALRLANDVGELSEGGFQPTVGTTSGDPGLIGLEKGLAGRQGVSEGANPSAALQQRRTENIGAVSNQVQRATERPESPDAARAFFEGEYRSQVGAAEAQAVQRRQTAEAGVETAESELAAARSEVDDIIGEYSPLRGERTPASEQIDETVKSELARLTKEKNELARNVDANRTVLVDKAPLREAVRDASTPKGPLDATPEDLPAGLMQRLRRATAKPRKGQPEPDLSFADIQDLRPALSSAIKKARAEDQGHVVKALLKIRNAMDGYIDDVAEGSFRIKGADTAGSQQTVASIEESRKTAAAAAERFREFYRETFAPRFKEGVGADIRNAYKRGKPVRPSATGRKFINPETGSKEAAQDIRRIAEGAEDPAKAAEQIRRYIVADLANWAVDAQGRINRRAINTWLDRHRDVLDQFPAVKRDIQAMARRGTAATERAEAAQAGVAAAQKTLKQEVTDAAKQVKQTKDAYERSVAGMFLDADPVEAMGRILRGDLPDQKVTELLAATRGNEPARNGIASALGEYLGQRLIKNDEQMTVILNQVQKLLKKPRVVRAIRKAAGEETVTTLRRVKRQMEVAERINQKVTSGSPTAPLRAAQEVVNAAINLKFGLLKGRKYINFTNKATSIVHGTDHKTAFMRLLTEAILDPEAGMRALTAREGFQKFPVLRMMMDTMADPAKRARFLENGNLSALFPGQDSTTLAQALERDLDALNRTRWGGQVMSAPPAEDER